MAVLGGEGGVQHLGECGPGGGGCYWALLGSADAQDIINNGGLSENQTLTIDSPYFETNDGGEWTKIG